MSDIIGQKKGGGEQHTHYEATDSLHSISYARVLDLVSEGEILGLAHGMRSVFLNQTPVENADGTTNFKDITVDFRTGTQIQDYIPGFPDVENEIAVGTELRSGTPWTHAVNNLSLSAIRITMSVPALSKSDTTNGDVLGYSVAYQIELSTDSGAYAVVLSNAFNGKTTTPYNRSARIDLPPATTGWSVRVTRLTANANNVSTADTTTIVSYTEVIDAKLRYPMSAIVGVQVDAKQFQSVPTRAYDMYGRIIQVPTNYDPVTRVYTGIWDGTFKPSWTSNPAWIFRDLVLNDRYGLGARISTSQLDKWALYAIAQYCDQLVPNGKGGTEPRFTCNLYLQSQKQAYAVLQDMASIFRGISYWGGGSIIASSDRPMDPVYVYTAANVIGGKFSHVGSSKKTRATVALVSWNDPADFYRAKVEYVEDGEGITRYGIQQISLTAFGCTSQGQAQRAGRWALATSRLETEAISFEVGMDGAIALPGQIVRIADPARMGRRNGGRVRTAAGRVVTLDKAPIINAGDSLTVILSSGVSETRTVASIAGDAVTVSADWTTVPLAQSVWSVDSSTLMAPTYKILSIKEKGDGLSYAITATQHEPGKFAYIENGTAIAPRPQTSLDVTKQAPPTSVTVSAFTVSLNDVQKLSLSVSCAAVPGAVAYEGAYRFGNGNWIPLARQPSPTFDVVDVLAGAYIAKIAAVNSIGITSIETLSAATSIAVAPIYHQGGSASPPALPSVSATYTFATGALTGLNNGWVQAAPATAGGYIHTSFAMAIAATATDAIAASDWAAVQLMYDATAVIAAQAAADAANTALGIIANDNVLSKGEKPEVILKWNTIAGEFNPLQIQADNLGVSHTSFDSDYVTLSSYLASINTSPAWTDVLVDTPITGTTFRANFLNYYNAKTALLNAIAAKTATLSTWAGTTGTGKPSDNATSDVVLVGRSGVTVIGNRLLKSGGTTGWNADAYSLDSYVGGAFASARADSALSALMFGLNSDPAADGSYTSIDFAIYLTAAGGLNCYESNVDRGSIGSYVAGDMIAVVFDGSTVRYLRNGTVLRTVAAVVTAPLFFDSSFNDVGASISNVRFGPMSSNAWSSIGGTGKPQDGATVGAPAGTNVGSTDAALIESRANAAVPTPTSFTLTGTFSGTVTNTSTGVLTLTKALSATASGAVGSVSLSWAIAVSDGFPSNFSLSSTTSATPTLTCRSSNQSISIGVTCTATDSSTGLSRVASGIVTFNMGAF